MTLIRLCPCRGRPFNALLRFITPLAIALLAGCNAESVREDAPSPAADPSASPLARPDVLIEPGPPPPDIALPSDVALLEGIRRRAEARRLASSTLQLDSGRPTYADVWERLRAGMALPDVDHERVQREIKWYAKRPQYLQRVTDRARLYLAHIVDQVEERGLPMELALLPIVESAFQPYARSSAGAVGMWQFIGPTGRRFGLRRSSWYDGRRDVLESTRAALDYLTYLHKVLKGDWLHALAGYNAGEGSVMRSVRRNRRAGRETDFFSLKLPAETEAYVPRLLAIAALIERPQDYGLTLDPIALEPYFEVVETPGQVDLAKAAKLAGIDLNELMLLNAGFNRFASDPKGPHRLLLPAESAAEFAAAIEREPKRLALSQRVHDVRPGDTLGSIAQRYATTVEALREANGLDEGVLAVGQALSVPAGFSAEQVAGLSREVREGMRRAAGATRRTVYRVRSGDSLWLIARRHDTTVARLKQWNRIGRRNILKPGQKLVVWTKKSARSKTRVAAAATASRAVYVVKRGDSLWTIARRHGVSTEQLRVWNRLRRKSLLKPGQTLRVATRRSAKSETPASS